MLHHSGDSIASTAQVITNSKGEEKERIDVNGYDAKKLEDLLKRKGWVFAAPVLLSLRHLWLPRPVADPCC